MEVENYFYNCSKKYISTINLTLFNELTELVSILPKRQTQGEINIDLFWILATKGWAYGSVPSGLSSMPPASLINDEICLTDIKKNNKHALCTTATTLDAKWCVDFAKLYNDKLVQIKIQFGKVESMFKDFAGFKIATFEKRLALGIEIVLSNPNIYFAHRKTAISGMAYFNIAQKTLPAIGLNCPIWLIGIKE